MSRTSCRLTVSLAIVLICLSTSALRAAPAPASDAAFLETLSAEAGCRSQVEASVVPKGLPPAPVNRIIYPDCGYDCSDPICSGATTGDPCFPSSGGQGTCTPHNIFCTGEFHRSPCTCDHVTGG